MWPYDLMHLFSLGERRLLDLEIIAYSKLVLKKSIRHS